MRTPPSPYLGNTRAVSVVSLRFRAAVPAWSRCVSAWSRGMPLWRRAAAGLGSGGIRTQRPREDPICDLWGF